MDLPQVLKKISEMLTTPEGEVVLAEAGLVAGTVSPPIGIVAESFSVFLQQYHEYKEYPVYNTDRIIAGSEIIKMRLSFITIHIDQTWFHSFHTP